MTVTVGQLKQWLSEYPDDRPVVLSSDAEGNRYRHLSAYGDCQLKSDDYDLELYDEQDLEYELEGYYDDEIEERKAELEALPKVVVFWPV